MSRTKAWMWTAVIVVAVVGLCLGSGYLTYEVLGIRSNALNILIGFPVGMLGMHLHMTIHDKVRQ